MAQTSSELYKSFDARDWAREFVKACTDNPSIATDEGTMLAWFSGAIMRGYDEHYWRSAEYKRMIRRALHPWWSWRRYFAVGESTR